MLTGKENKLINNFFSLGAVQAISSLIQLIVIPHVIRKIGVEGFGVVAVAQVVMFYLAVFNDYSFNQTATRDIALYKADQAKISAIFWKVLFTKFFLCFVALLLLLVLVLTIPLFRSHWLLYCMAFAFVAGQSVLITWFFQGLERMYFITIATLVARILFAVLVFVFINDKSDDFLFLFFLGAGNVIAGLISIVAAISMCQLKFIRPSKAAIATEIKEGWRITLSHLSNSTCHYANIFILRIFVSDLAVGYYSIAERIFFTIKQVFVMFSQAVYPRVCLLVQQGKEQTISFFRQVYSVFLSGVVAVSFLLFVFSPQVLYFFIGSGYSNSIFYLRIFCIVAVIVCLNIPGTLILLAMNQQKKYLRVYLIATILNILLNFILAFYFEATGTVIAIVVTEIVITVAVTQAMYRRDEQKGIIPIESPNELIY